MPSDLAPPPGRFQFSLGRILWAMLVCALLSGVVRALGAPDVVQLALLALALTAGLYLVLRLPFVLGDLLGKSNRWRQIRGKRQALQAYADDKRRAARGEATTDGTSRPG